MIASNFPFTVRHEVTLNVPSQQAWDKLTEPDPWRWNYALQYLESSLGFHTGSVLRMTLKSLSGPWTIKAEVQQAIPMHCLYWTSSFRCHLLRHREHWQLTLNSIQPNVTRVSFSYAIEGIFAAKIWPQQRYLADHVLELWLESLKQTLERL